MKKNIGSKLALYPTPLVVVGTMVGGKPNWCLVGHLGIIGHDRVMVSMSDSHYTNQGIRTMNTLSINIVDEAMLGKADGRAASAEPTRTSLTCLPITLPREVFPSLTHLRFPWSAPWTMFIRPKALRALSAKLPQPMRKKQFWMKKDI